MNLAQGLPVSTVAFGVAVTLPREPACPGKGWYRWLCEWVTELREGPLGLWLELGAEAALTFGGREEPSWGQELVTVGQGKSQRARGSCGAAATGRGQCCCIRTPVAVGGDFGWHLVTPHGQLPQFQSVCPALLLAMPRGQVQQAEDISF